MRIWRYAKIVAGRVQLQNVMQGRLYTYLRAALCKNGAMESEIIEGEKQQLEI